MKKILIIIPSIQKGGGAENVATNIGNKLYEKGYKIHYLIFYKEKDEIKVKGEIYYLNEKKEFYLIKNILKIFTRAYHIYKYVKNKEIDVSISHLDEANFSTILSKIIFHHKSKIIIEIHNSIEKSLSNLYITIYRFIMKYSDKIVSLTKEDIKNIKNKFNINENKIINIYNPIDLNHINRLKKEKVEIDINKSDFILLNIGRLNQQKNQKLLIDGFNSFNKKVEKSKLIILGEGILEKELKQQVKKINNKNIIFLGRIDNPYKYISKADYLVMTSEYEGLPVTQIESLGCSTPIISSNCKTGPKEILHINSNDFTRDNQIEICDCGILFPTGNKVKYIESLNIAYNNHNNIRKQFKSNIELQKNNFDINNIIKIREKIIEE